MHSSLLHALDHHVAVRGDKVFTRHLSADGVEELTFAGFQQRAAQFARFYQANGCGAGDVVLIFLATSPDVLASFVGAMMIDAVSALMPLPSAKQHPAIYWESHATLLQRIRPTLILTDRESAKAMTEHGLDSGERRIVAVEDVPAAPGTVPVSAAGPDAVALLQHSSGTTSLKKGVMLSHGAILRQVESYAASLGATAEDGIGSWLPVYHDMGLIACSMTPLVLGQTVTILNPFAWVARPASLLDAVQRYDCRFVWMPNFAFEHMARTVPDGWSGDLSGVRAFINCSEPCKPETFERFRARFESHGLREDALQVCYAMAETVFAVSQTRPGAAPRVLEIDRFALGIERVAREADQPGKALRVLSNGAVLAGLDVSIRDPDTHEPLGERAIGEIAVKGAFLFDGYHDAPELTAERFAGETYLTRDLGFLADGELYVLGRKDDLIIVNGRNLHAHEVEALAADVPGLKAGRAVAFGVFSEVNASEELVIVAERAGADADVAESARRLRERVFDETNIDVKDVVIVDPDWLVKTTSGKISREKNRDKYLRERPATVSSNAAVQEQDDTLAAIAQVIARLFDYPAEDISRDTVAAHVSGWDSLAHATLILEVEKALGITFADDEMFSFPDVGSLVDRAIALQGTGVSDRIVLDDDDVSIVRMGEGGDGPDFVIFAGAAEMFGGQTLMDFASTLDGTSVQHLRKFFVTDKKKRWFTESFDRIVDAINTASPGEKIVIGNSMGGYGALKLGPRLHGVKAILAIAPQPSIPRHLGETLGRDGEEWFVRPAPEVPTCVVYGEVEDENGKEWIAQTFVTEGHNPMLELANCGHNVVISLNKLGLLRDVLLCSVEPATMLQRVGEILAGVRRSAEILRTHVLRLPTPKKRRALRHLIARLEEEGLPPLAPEHLADMGEFWQREPRREKEPRIERPIDKERLLRRIRQRRLTLDRRRREAAQAEARPVLDMAASPSWQVLYEEWSAAVRERARMEGEPRARGEQHRRRPPEPTQILEAVAAE